MFLHGKFNRSQNISIHSLRMEGDNSLRTVSKGLFNFNPLPPHGGRQLTVLPCASSIISIHSLRMEGDLTESPSMRREWIISIHSLRMEGDSKTAQESVFHFDLSLYNPAKKDAKDYISAPEKMVFFEKREKNLVRNLQHLSVRL